MGDLEKGITRNGAGYGGKSWNILGQVYFPKAVADSTFAFETNSNPGQFVPVHIHPTQDEFIFVQEGVLDLKLDGVWVRAEAGDLVRMPRGIPHGYFNKSDKPARALFWVSPAQKLEALFDKLHNLQDPNEVVRIAAEHDVNFLPPDANEAGAHRVQVHAPGRPLFRLMPSARHRSGVPSYWKMSSPKLS